MCDCRYCTETEEENAFWADVYYYMRDNNCSKEDAQKEVWKIYKQDIVIKE